jgi:hypothetical protein
MGGKYMKNSHQGKYIHGKEAVGVTEAIGSVWSQFDWESDTLDSRKDIMSKALHNDKFEAYLQTEHYSKYGNKKKDSSRADEEYMSLQLEKMANLLLEMDDNFEFSLQKGTDKEHTNITNQMNDIGIHIDQLSKFNKDYHNTAKKYKKPRQQQRNEKEQFLENAKKKYDVLQEKQTGLDQMDSLLKDKQGYISNHETMIKRSKVNAFKEWEKGLDRVVGYYNTYTYDGKIGSLMDEFYSIQSDRWRSIPLANLLHRPEYMEANCTSNPIVDDKSKEKKWQSTLGYYGVAEKGTNQYGRLRKLRNTYKGEMNDIAEGLTGFIQSKHRVIETGREKIAEDVTNLFDLSNPDHIFSLLSYQKEKGKFYPLYHMLHEEYADKPDSDIYGFLIVFDDLVEHTVLKDMERAVVDIMLQRETIDIDEPHPYKRVAIYINNQFETELKNEQIKRLVTKIAKKVVNTYTGKIMCTKCKKHKEANMTYFGVDQRKSNGLKSTCKECDNKNAKKYRK